MYIPAKPKRTVPKQFQSTAKKLAKQPQKKGYGIKSMKKGYRGP